MHKSSTNIRGGNVQAAQQLPNVVKKKLRQASNFAGDEGEELGAAGEGRGNGDGGDQSG